MSDLRPEPFASGFSPYTLPLQKRVFLLFLLFLLPGHNDFCPIFVYELFFLSGMGKWDRRVVMWERPVGRDVTSQQE